MTPEHFKEIKETPFVSWREDDSSAMAFQLGLAQGHRNALIEACEQLLYRNQQLQQRLESAECIIRQAARDTFGRDMTPQEFADASSYDS